MALDSRFQSVIQLLRWHAPVGAFLLFFPCLWGLIAGFQGLPPLRLVCLFLGGAFFMRSAGCVYNDWVDRDLDRNVARTANRPLAAGTLSGFQALCLLGGLLAISFLILLQFDLQTIGVGLGSMGLVLLYPWAKRFTCWPQVCLGLAFNWGVWVGWSASGAASGAIFNWKPAVLYGVGVVWTLAYDTIYAYQDYHDDQQAGIKSSAVYLQQRGVWFLRICWVSILVLLLLLGFGMALNPLYFLGLSIVAAHFIWQDRYLDLESPEKCGKVFRSNQWVGLLISLSLLAGTFP
ncbi:MAG: 4-hydroxybenzoate octaprenyltransferase [Alphaproteobacteria bacterium]